MTSTFHIAIAMKPCEGTFAENALKHGVAGLAIDACRIGYQSKDDFENAKGGDSGGSQRAMDGWGLKRVITQSQKITPTGRFPANICHDNSIEILAEFDKAGKRGDNGTKMRGVKVTPKSGEGMFGGGENSDGNRHGDEKGSAARFFHAVNEYEIESEER